MRETKHTQKKCNWERERETRTHFSCCVPFASLVCRGPGAKARTLTTCPASPALDASAASTQSLSALDTESDRDRDRDRDRERRRRKSDAIHEESDHVSDDNNNDGDDIDHDNRHGGVGYYDENAPPVASLPGLLKEETMMTEKKRQGSP